MSRKYPRSFAESTIARMRKKLNMPNEDLKLLEDYFTAISNFYEILPLCDAFRVIEQLSAGLVTRQKFLDFADMKRHTPNLDYRIYGKESFFSGATESDEMEREIIHVSVIEVDEYFYHELKNRQYGLPLYIPSKNQLLSYVREEYYEKNEYTRALKDFLMGELYMDDTEADEYILDAYMHIRVCAEPEGAFLLWTEFLEKRADNIDGNSCPFSDMQYDTLASLFYDMYDNTRLPCYRGYTFNERFNPEDIERLAEGKGYEGFYGYDYLPAEGKYGNIAGFPYSGSYATYTGDYVDSKVTKKKK